MKIWAISLCLLLLLTGCDPGSELERGMALRSAVLSAEKCCMDVHITADYGDFLSQFSLTCLFDNKGDLSFSVLQPESIEGIKGGISSSEGSIQFENTVLYFDLLADEQLSPISAPWILMKALRSGYLKNACIDGTDLLLTFEDSFEDDALQVDIWLDSDNIPERAEILFRGYRILSMKLENFQFL